MKVKIIDVCRYFIIVLLTHIKLVTSKALQSTKRQLIGRGVKFEHEGINPLAALTMQTTGPAVQQADIPDAGCVKQSTDVMIFTLVFELQRRIYASSPVQIQNQTRTLV